MQSIKLMSLTLVNLLKTDYDDKASDIDSKIPSITGSPNTTAFTPGGCP